MINGIKSFVSSEIFYTIIPMLGLSKAAAELYGRSLAEGPAPISSLAKSLGWSRPKLYGVVKELDKHGLSDRKPNGSRSQKYSVSPPTVVLELMRRRNQRGEELENSLVDMMPGIIAMMSANDKSVPFRVVHGAGGMRALFREMNAKAKYEICHFGSLANLVRTLSPETYASCVKLRNAKSVVFKSLGVRPEDLRTYEKHMGPVARSGRCRICRNIDFFDSSLHISGDQLFFWDTKNMRASHFVSREAAALAKAAFNSLWASAE